MKHLHLGSGLKRFFSRTNVWNINVFCRYDSDTFLNPPCIKIYCGRQDGLDLPTLASKLSSPGFESRHSDKLSSRCFTGRVNPQVCAVPRMDVKLGVLSASICWWTLKIPWVSFMKSRQAITVTLDKFEIPTLTSRGYCISGTAPQSINNATPQPCAAYERRSRIKKNLILM